MFNNILSCIEEQLKNIELQNQNVPGFAKKRRRIDGDFSVILAQNLYYYPRDIVRELEKSHGNLDNFIVIDEIRNNGLVPELRREKWGNFVKNTSKNLQKFLFEEKHEVLLSLLQDIEKAIFINPMLVSRIQAKTILLMFYENIKSDDRTNRFSQKLKQVVMEADFGQCRFLLKKIVEIISTSRNVKKKEDDKYTTTPKELEKRDITESPKEIEKREDIAQISDEVEKRDITESPKEIEKREDIAQISDEVEKRDIFKTTEETTDYLRTPLEETDDLRTALEVATHNFKELEREIHTIRTNADIEAVTNFFREMNSMKYGYLLDQIACVEKQIQDLKERKVRFSAEFENIAIAIRMFMKFVRDYGLLPIATVGERRKVSLHESASYEYIGPDFESESEIREIVIKSPGWQYKKIIISPPKTDTV